MFMGLILVNIGGVLVVIWLGEIIGWWMLFLVMVGLGVILMVSLFFLLFKGGVGV